MKQLRIVVLGVLALGAFLSEGTHGGDLVLTRQTCDGGGVIFSSAGTVELSGTIGQPDAGTMTGARLVLTGGFWFSLAPGDCNTDGLVDLSDYAQWSACLVGPHVRLPAGCACFDLDRDGDIDLFDAAVVQTAFLGS